MSSSGVKSTDLVCMDCGNICSIMRKIGRLKKVSHRKHLWCYKCQKVTEHFEVQDVSKFIWIDTEDETELFVKDLIKNGRKNKQSKTNRVFKKILKK